MQDQTDPGKPRTTLAAGAAGFIGWKATDLLLCNRHRLRDADHLRTESYLRLRSWRLVQLKEQPGLTFHLSNTHDRAGLREIHSEPLENGEPKFPIVICLDNVWTCSRLLENCDYDSLSRSLETDATTVKKQGDGERERGLKAVGTISPLVSRPMRVDA